MIKYSENAGKVTEEGEFHCVVCRKGLGSNSILCQFWWLRLHKRCGIRSKLKEDSKVRFQTSANQQLGIPEDSPGIELNDKSLENKEKFHGLGYTIARGGSRQFSNKERNVWSKFRVLVHLLPVKVFRNKRQIIFRMCTQCCGI